MPIIPWDRWFGLQSDKDAEILRLKRELAYAKRTAGKDARIATLEKQLQETMAKPVAPATPAKATAGQKTRKPRATPKPVKNAATMPVPGPMRSQAAPSTSTLVPNAGPAPTPQATPPTPKPKED